MVDAATRARTIQPSEQEEDIILMEEVAAAGKNHQPSEQDEDNLRRSNKRNTYEGDDLMNKGESSSATDA